MKYFTSRQDVSDPDALLAQAKRYQAHSFIDEELGRRKVLICLFFNASLRTRLSTELAARRLGMEVIVMNVAEAWKLEFADGTVMNLDRAEHIREAAGVLSQYADILAVRSFPGLTDRSLDYADHIMQAFCKHASVPVLSLESAIRHPLQSLADWLTIDAYRTQRRPKVVLSWAPHPRALPQAVANSFLEWMAPTEVELVLTHPPGYALATQFSRGIPVIHDQMKALQDADFVYVKNWSAYAEYGQVIQPEQDWMITTAKMQQTNQAYFMHCLPVRRNVVVSDAVLDGERSLVLEQARNRVVAAQAVLSHLLKTTS